MVPADIGGLVSVGDPRVSPDGAMVAVTVGTIDMVANAERSRIWVAPVDGSAPPRPLTTVGDARESRARWSPDGTRLAFVTRGEGPGSQVVVSPVAGGAGAIVAAQWADEVTELAWSPDGTRLAMLARAPRAALPTAVSPGCGAPGTGALGTGEVSPGSAGPAVAERDRPPRRVTRFVNRIDNVGWTMDRAARVYVVAADGSSAPVVVDGPGAVDADASGLSWGAEDRLAWCQPVAPDWDVALSQPVIVAPVPGSTGTVRMLGTDAHLLRPALQPDDNRVAVVTGAPADPPRNGQIAVVGDGEMRVLTASLDRNCGLRGYRGPAWEADHIWFVAEDRGAVHLYRVGAAGAAPPEVVVGGNTVVTGFDVAGGTVAYTATGATCTGELYVLDPTTRDGRRCLTAFGRPFAEAVTLGEPASFTVSTADGAQIDAWYLAPTGAARAHRATPPTLVNVHGGPFAQYTGAFFDEFAIQAGAGYGVLWCNPRGSSGRSEAWGRAIRGPRCEHDPGSGWGGVDADDVLAVVDAAVARFDLDPHRVGILGGSYGGFMASWLVGHTDRFACACSERSVNNQLTMVWTSDIGTSFQRGYVGVSHLREPGEYLRMSPVSYVEAITTPMLLLHADGDLRCPVSQAEELWTALRLLGRDVELVRFAGSGHELSRSGPPKQRMWRAEILLDFFARHLQTGTDTAEPRPDIETGRPQPDAGPCRAAAPAWPPGSPSP